MEIDISKVRRQEEADEPAAMDKADDRVEAELKLIESKAKEQVAQGLGNDELKREAEREKKEAERDLKALGRDATE
jgi:phage gp36-like protein